MIKLNRLNGELIVINGDNIETVEAVPETLITLSTGNKYLVVQSIDEVINKYILYKREVNSFKVKRKSRIDKGSD